MTIDKYGTGIGLLRRGNYRDLSYELVTVRS